MKASIVLILTSLLLSVLSIATKALSQQGTHPNCKSSPIQDHEFSSIKRALEADPPITSVEDFIHCLPSQYFQYGHHTYLKQSLAPEAVDITPELPGVILFGPEGRTIIRYVGKQDGRFPNEVRIIAKGESGLNNRFITVNFAKDRKPDIIESDANCVSCHKGRQLWGSYRKWPQAFGTASDLQWLPRDFQGYLAFGSFTEAQRTNPRYERLMAAAQRGDNHTEAVEYRGQQVNPRNPYAPGAGDFLDVLSEAHGKIIAKKLAASQDLPKLQYTILSTFLGCKLDSKVEQNLEEVFQEQFINEPLYQAYRTQNLPFRGVESHNNNEYNVFRLASLGRLLGVSVDEWSLALTSGNRFDWYLQGPGFDLGSGREIRDYVLRELIAILKPSHKAVEQIFHHSRWISDYGSILHSYYQARNRPPSDYQNEECQTLEPLVTRESETWATQNFNNVAPLTKEDPSLTNSSEVTRDFMASPQGRNLPYSATLITCYYCHVVDASVPKIPFQNQEQLKTWLKSDHTFRGQKMKGIQLIESRVLDTNEMPIGKALVQKERRQILEELKQLLETESL